MDKAWEGYLRGEANEFEIRAIYPKYAAWAYLKKDPNDKVARALLKNHHSFKTWAAWKALGNDPNDEAVHSFLKNDHFFLCTTAYEKQRTNQELSPEEAEAIQRRHAKHPNKRFASPLEKCNLVTAVRTYQAAYPGAKVQWKAIPQLIAGLEGKNVAECSFPTHDRCGHTWKRMKRGGWFEAEWINSIKADPTLLALLLEERRKVETVPEPAKLNGSSVTNESLLAAYPDGHFAISDGTIWCSTCKEPLPDTSRNSIATHVQCENHQIHARVKNEHPESYQRLMTLKQHPALYIPFMENLKCLILTRK